MTAGRASRRDTRGAKLAPIDPHTRASISAGWMPRMRRPAVSTASEALRNAIAVWTANLPGYGEAALATSGRTAWSMPRSIPARYSNSVAPAMAIAPRIRARRSHSRRRFGRASTRLRASPMQMRQRAALILVRTSPAASWPAAANPASSPPGRRGRRKQERRPGSAPPTAAQATSAIPGRAPTSVRAIGAARPYLSRGLTSHLRRRSWVAGRCRWARSTALSDAPEPARMVARRRCCVAES